MKPWLLMLACTLLFGAAAAHAEFYRWTDKDGREFITNEKETIPAESRHTAKPVDVREDRVSVGDPHAAAGAPSVKPAEHKDKYGRGEAYWHKRAENLRRQIREQQDKRDEFARQQKKEEQKAAGKRSGKSSSKKNTNRDKKTAAIEHKIARLQRELDVDLPEEARKADAYPGWLRE
ncbi:MAG: DUF4124 domain-containing protein [Nitrospiraceae bacterium]|nr:DUF4124 domain-containing protein [Nitrospiraceae bacterium]